EQLIEQYMSLVRSLARRYSYRGEQFEDLVQIGAIGLIKAIDRFDLDRGVELTTYATPNIIGEIKRHFRDRGWSVRVPRGLQELNIQLSRLLEEKTVELGRSPTIAELAEAAEVTDEEVLEALESGRAYSSLSLSSGPGLDDEGDLDPLESLGTEEHEYEVSEDRAILAPGFRVLDDRERTILHLRFFKGLTQSQIAQQVGISQMHVSRLIRRSLEKIREEPVAPRVTTVQKGVRAGGKQNDLDDVGLTNRHLCFMEMLGNFSFGDYFKDGAVDFAWEFVTEHLKFDPDRLSASVFAGDPELGLGEDEVAIASWARYVPRERIVGLPRSENFWQAADTGPCGPCSEIHYDRGEEHGCGRPTCGPGCECDRFLEVWNLVFMEYDLAEDGTLTPLPRQNIDTGMGLERAAMLLQGVESVFDS